MVAFAHHKFSFEDYLRVEDDSVIRHEFLEGAIWAMAGGSPEHAAICANLIAALSTALATRRCRVYTTDLRIRVQATGLATYPDVSVICDRAEMDPLDPRRHTAINPKLLAEVLSPSTEEYDCGEKLSHYQQIPSLEEVLLVHHDARKVTVWRRQGGGWTSSVHVEGAISLALGCELSLDTIYRDPLA
jgi:Uma2 family endonuclease